MEDDCAAKGDRITVRSCSEAVIGKRWSTETSIDASGRYWNSSRGLVCARKTNLGVVMIVISIFPVKCNAQQSAMISSISLVLLMCDHRCWTYNMTQKA